MPPKDATPPHKRYRTSGRDSRPNSQSPGPSIEPSHGTMRGGFIESSSEWNPDDLDDSRGHDLFTQSDKMHLPRQRATSGPSTKPAPILPLLERPSEEEAHWFYHGMPSQPRLVARASSGIHPWESLADQEKRFHSDVRAGKRPRSTWFAIRTLTPGPLGNHPIRSRYKWSVHVDFVESLVPLRWTSIDFLQLIATDYMCDVELFTGQTTVWVGLEHVNHPWEVVANAVRKCRVVLDNARLADVDIQFRISKVERLTGKHVGHSTTPHSGSGGSSNTRNVLLGPLESGVPPYFSEQDNPFRTTLGQPVFYHGTPTIRGTFGLFFWPSCQNNSKDGKIKNILGLTCRHVGMPADTNDALSIVQKINPEKMAQHRRDYPNTPRVGIADNDMANKFIENLDRSNRRLTTELQKGRSGNLQKKSEMLSYVQKLYNAVAPFRDEKARELGPVIYSPSIGPVRRQGLPRLWTRDTCVFMVDSSMLPAGEGTDVSMSTKWPANIVDLRGFVPEDLTEKLEHFNNVVNPYRPGTFADQAFRRVAAHPPAHFSYPEDGLLQVRGMIPADKLFSAKGPAMDHTHTGCNVVGMAGAQSGVTWGWTSEMNSFIRDYERPGVPEFDTSEIAIYGMGPNGSQTTKPVPFSARGDSGSVVFGVDGRLAGFLTGGAQLATGTDISYASPAELVLKDIQSALGTELSFY